MANSLPKADSEEVLQVVDEFLQLRRSGQQPSVADYVAKYPNLAGEIREVLPAIVALERIADNRAEDNPNAGATSRAGKSTPASADAIIAALEPSHVPSTLDRYRLKRPLGSGAMGVVFLARDERLGRDVALKIPRVGNEDTQAIRRFEREARAMATAKHPNLCAVHDFGETDGWLFLAMDYIEGDSLASMLAAGAELPGEEAARLVRTIAQAVQAAHDAGVVHRDLKPSNIMIDNRGEPFVMDFGLARSENHDDLELTREGAIVGSPAYMAPEQVTGNHDLIGPATDVYALGVLLYEILCGGKPFKGSTYSVMKQIELSEPAPPSSIRTGVDSRLESICLKAMSKRIAHRYLSAAELAKELDSFLQGGVFEDSSTSVWPRRLKPASYSTWTVLWAAGGLLSLILSGVFSSRLQPATAENKTDHARVTGVSISPAGPPSPSAAALRRHIRSSYLPPAPFPTHASTGRFYDSGQRLGEMIDSQNVELADLDGDGDLDAFVACGGAQPDRIWRNDGKARFHDDGQRLGAGGTAGLALGDVDGDGDFDAITVCQNGQSCIWFNRGNGRFVESHRLPESGHSPSLGDLDGDGDLDLFLCRVEKANLVLWNDGHGKFTNSGQRLGGASSVYAGLGDLNGDGHLDAYVCNMKSADVVYINDGQGRFHAFQLNLPASDSHHVALTDWNQDGSLDAIVCGWDSGVELWLNDGTGTLGLESDAHTARAWNSVRAGDLDGDGDPDVLAAAGWKFPHPDLVWRNKSSVGLEEPEYFGFSNAWCSAIGDLDRDGDLDVFVGNAGEPDQVWLNRDLDIPTTPLFVESIQNFSARSAAFADFDGDGDQDAIAIGSDAPNRIYSNDGRGKFFDSGQQLGLGKGGWAAVGDVDRDEDLDLLVTGGGDGPDRLWINDGRGNFHSSNQQRFHDDGLRPLFQDFDGDGDLDAFITVYQAEDKLWVNDGAGRFTDSGQRLQGEGSRHPVAGDFDSDGDIDVVVCANGHAGTRIWLNDGFGEFTLSGQILLTPQAQSVGSADLDGNGTLDLAIPAHWRDYADQVFFNLGNARFEVSPQKLSDLTPTDVALGDLDGDGDVDLLVANWYRRPNQVLLNDGSGHFIHEQWLGRFDSTVALVDADGDSDLDIFEAVLGGDCRIWLNQSIVESTNESGP